jgi:hypothetical protein
MGGVLIMSIRDQEYGASLDLQQLCPFRMKFRFVEVGTVEAENPPHTDAGAWRCVRLQSATIPSLTSLD